jgi:hypothetical protein
MTATTRTRRWLWFAALYLLGLAGTAALAYGVRLLLGI